MATSSLTPLLSQHHLLLALNKGNGLKEEEAMESRMLLESSVPQAVLSEISTCCYTKNNYDNLETQVLMRPINAEVREENRL